MKEAPAKIGILTFHCANNFGAMLQAYALKTFLCAHGREADIVRYEPFYMVGRHWWFPYIPWKGLKDRLWGIWYLAAGFWPRWQMRETYSAQLRNMKAFREQYLVDRRRRKIRTLAGLCALRYPYYVLGSDQIWNPKITCGLRRAYFGAFYNRHKEKVVSYAASLGGAALPDGYDAEFAKLVRHVDVLSVREQAAVPYVERLSGKEATAVLDPVFFLRQEAWQRVERIPPQARGRDYLLFYVTEANAEMTAYAQALARETGLAVIELCAEPQKADTGFAADLTAGPAELLGYIHNAAFVVSNSFHAVAFSILYEKQFLAFLHSRVGERIENILRLHGLLERLYAQPNTADIRAPIDWQAVRGKTEALAEASGAFLLRHLPE